MNEYQARNFLRDAAMRRALLKFLWNETKPAEKIERPMPILDDDDRVKEELQRILGIKKGLFS